MKDDRRAIIAEAMEASDAANTPEPIEVSKPVETATPEPVEKETPEPIETATPEPVVAKETPEPVAKETPEPVVGDKPPQSWRPAEKAKWATVDPSIKSEIIRREREITTALGETAQARQIAHQFQEAVQPFMARIQAQGVTPTQAVGELLKADYILSTAPTNQRAQYMAKLIADYGVDIQALDAALSGQPQAAGGNPQLEQLLEQRLAPVQQFIQQQTRIAQQNEEAERNKNVQAIQSMAADTAKYPYFDDVRSDMADLLEINSKKGVYLSLEQAYNRAIAMNPEVNQLVSQQRSVELKKQQVAQANAKAQRALSASKSVGGTPSLVNNGPANASDRRATIAAAFDELSGR